MSKLYHNSNVLGASAIFSGCAIAITGGTGLIRDPLSITAFAVICAGCVAAAFGGYIIGNATHTNQPDPAVELK